MTKLSDSELSLAVAKILWPKYSFRRHSLSKKDGSVFLHGLHATEPNMHRSIGFTHTTDDALGKMCVWLANNHGYVGHNATKFTYLKVGNALTSSDPNRAIAEAILEANND